MLGLCWFVARFRRCSKPAKVAILWGTFFFREFAGTTRRVPWMLQAPSAGILGPSDDTHLASRYALSKTEELPPCSARS